MAHIGGYFFYCFVLIIFCSGSHVADSAWQTNIEYLTVTMYTT
uniref:Uncharacterized protein n=1 Tax=Arundo donax TaxID=35708 RepID=A0A0A9BF24_ARUDO